ncbi:MAG: hypothetical protein WC162_04545 [Sphaerochaetaceae bacterium]
MGSKEITLTVCEVVDQDAITSISKLEEKLDKVLKSTGSISNRIAKLSSRSEDSDFISSYEVLSNGALFGTFIRMNPNFKAVVSASSLNETQMPIEDLLEKSSKDSAGAIKSSAFFYIQKGKMILSSSYGNRKPFETYINWLLREKADEPSSILINETLDINRNLEIREIKSIELKESFLYDAMKEGMKNDFSLRKYLTNKLFYEKTNFDEMAMEDIISACLTIKINSKELKERNSLQAVFRTIDSDYIIIKTKDGKKIIGSNCIVKYKIPVELTQNGYYNELEVKRFMEEKMESV